MIVGWMIGSFFLQRLLYIYIEKAREKWERKKATHSQESHRRWEKEISRLLSQFFELQHVNDLNTSKFWAPKQMAVKFFFDWTIDSI